MADKHPSAKAPQKTVVSLLSTLPHLHVHELPIDGRLRLAQLGQSSSQAQA
jgi:hypothetical protein